PTLLLKARIKSEVKRASLLEIREKVETGKLVDADEMHAAAFSRGHEIRAAWEAWPNRVAGPMGAELGVEMRTLRSTLEKFVREHLLELTGMMNGEQTDE
ncbi:MAG: elements of external origin, partial [Magnetococcales bacterium]|nr:elements of external origin [Magnetococcales bacterium]